jgi:hypothetical protein
MEDSVVAIPIINIDEAEIYQVNGSKQKKIEKGFLQVLHIASMNCFLVQVGNFRYSLSKEIPILASSKYPNCIRSYVFPNIEGYYVIRIISVSDLQIISGLEQIFLNHADFAEEREDDAVEQEKSSRNNEVKEPAKEEKKTKTEIASNIIYKGGELVGAGLKKGGELIAKGINLTGDFIQEKFIKKKVEKDVNESTINKLKIANTATNTAVMITRVQVSNLPLYSYILDPRHNHSW